MADSETKQQASSAHFPDLYRLLELTPLESERGPIEAALKRVLKIAKEAKGGEPQVAKKAARLLELGKQNLLDAKRKAAYDAKWRAVYGDVSREQALEEDWQWGLLDGYLPDGDPARSFDLSEFLSQSEELPESDPGADFQKLMSLLKGEQHVVTPEVATNVSPAGTAQAVQPQVTSATNTEGHVQPQVVAQPVTQPARLVTAPAGATKAKSIARKIRRKRDRSMLLAAIGVLASLAAVLGVMFVVLRPDSTSDVPSPSPAAASPAVAQGPNPQVPQPARPKGSGLPQVSGLGEQDSAPTPMPQPVGAAMGTNEVAGGGPTGGPKPAPGGQPSGEGRDGMATSPDRPTPAPARDPVLTDQEKNQWRQAMNQVRTLLGEQKYAEATKEMASLQELAKTKPQKDQFIRLKTVASLAEQFHQALVEAIGGLSAGETFTAGTSTPVSFVEGGPSRLVVRISGRNQRFDLTELPVGIALGLVDLKLDLEHASSLAKKAAFIVFHPTRNDLALVRAKKLMTEAAAAGQVPNNTVAIFEDDYQL